MAETIHNASARITAPYTLEIERREISLQLEGGQVLVRNIYSLISPGTELAIFTRSHVGFDDPDNLWAKYPFYPGYAAVGRIDRLGSTVSGLSIGDLVYHQGPHQSYTLVSSDQVLPVPAGIPLPWVPFARFGQIANSAVLVSEAQPGDAVAIIGLGLIGNMAAQLFRLKNAEVIGIDPVAKRRDLARASGIKKTIDPGQQEPVAAVRETTGGRGARTVVEATGDPALITPALQMARVKGEVILLGGPRGTANLDVYNLIQNKGVFLKGAHETLYPEAPSDRLRVARQMLGWLHRLHPGRRLAVEHLITEVVAPDEIRRCYTSLLTDKENAMTMIIDWGS